MADNELDVRQLRKPDKHPAIFATYADLPLLGSFVLVNNHDPKHPQIVFVKRSIATTVRHPLRFAGSSGCAPTITRGRGLR